MLEVGTKAPDFELPDQNGEMHKLSDYAGKKVILYFYPKDNTAGCTKQACGFSERYPQFTEKGAVILGVSKDSVASHKKFEEKYGLAFTLLADPDRKVIEAYDVWKEKKNYGKVSMGVVRTTYLINEQGVIIKANDKLVNNPKDLVITAEKAEKMYKLKDEKITIDGEDITIGNYYNNIVQKLGNETKEVIRNEKNQSKLLEETDNLRLNVSGVSLDEEMVNLIQFQHSYNASAKVISTIDSLLDVVVNGLVR